MTGEQVEKYFPGLIFLKTKTKITRPQDVSFSNYIFEEDTPDLNKLDRFEVVPICVTEYPRLCAYSSAMDLGGWLLTYCHDQKLDLTWENFDKCLKFAEENFVLGEVE